MKGPMALLVALLCSLFPVTISNPQTNPKKSPTVPYDDPDGYLVLSSIIDARTAKWNSEPVSIFRRTISERSLKTLESECSDKIPTEFRSAAEDLGKKATNKYQLQARFSTKKKYAFVSEPVGAGAIGVFSVSVVGFDVARTHAIALVEYLVHPTTSAVLGGDSTFHLLRKTDNGWQEATESSKCGRIY